MVGNIQLFQLKTLQSWATINTDSVDGYNKREC